MKTAKDFSLKYIDEYNQLTAEIEYQTEKLYPITKKQDDRRNDLSRLFLALAGNPNTENGFWAHGEPLIYKLMEEYASQFKNDHPKEAVSDEAIEKESEKYFGPGINSANVIIWRAGFIHGMKTMRSRHHEPVKLSEEELVKIIASNITVKKASGKSGVLISGVHGAARTIISKFQEP